MTILFPGVQESSVPSTTIKNSNGAALATPSTPQEVATTSITYLTGSKLPVPNGGLNLGAKYAFDLEVTKNDTASTATSVVAVLAGPNGDVTDTVIATFTKPASTANVGEARISVKGSILPQTSTTQVPYLTNSAMTTINGTSTSGVMAVPTSVIKALTTLSTTQVAAIAAAQYVGLAVTLGASSDYTFNQVDAELSGLSTGAPNQ